MIFARVGHLLYPAPREGAVAFEACVSYSGACVSIDELRWMRNPDWSFSATREFFASENLNDGYLSNHIWDWGIDGDESNQDFIYDVTPIIYRHARVKSVTGFYVFWARLAEQKHLQMLNHLFNQATFWTEYPLPSLPLDYEKYIELQETN
jgi:hypothetical protein